MKFHGERVQRFTGSTSSKPLSPSPPVPPSVAGILLLLFGSFRLLLSANQKLYGGHQRAGQTGGLEMENPNNVQRWCVARRQGPVAKIDAAIADFGTARHSDRASPMLATSSPSTLSRVRRRARLPWLPRANHQAPRINCRHLVMLWGYEASNSHLQPNHALRDVGGSGPCFARTSGA